MITHHTKNKGDLGVLKAKLDLFLQGYLVLVPETEHAPFDLAIYKNCEFKTVQVKYRAVNKRGVIEIPFRNSYSTAKGVNTKKVNKALVSIYAVYCPQTDSCYYFNPLEYGESIALRVNASVNHQQKGTHLADDFKKVP